MARNAEQEYRVKAQEWVRDVLMPALQDWIQSFNMGKGPVIETPQPLETILKVQHPWPHPVSSVDMIGETSQRQMKKVTYTVCLSVTADGVTGHISLDVEGESKRRLSIVDNILEKDASYIVKDLNRRMAGIQNEI